MDLQLQGKRALVTGGSRGIGKAIARVLAQEGCDVALLARNREPLDGGGARAGGRDPAQRDRAWWPARRATNRSQAALSRCGAAPRRRDRHPRQRRRRAGRIRGAAAAGRYRCRVVPCRDGHQGDGLHPLRTRRRTRRPRPPRTSPKPRRASRRRARRHADARGLADQVLLLGFDGTDASSPFLEQVRTRQLGGVLVERVNWLDAASGTALVGGLRAAGRDGDRIPPLIVTTQEGGDYRALADLPPEETQLVIGDAGSFAAAEDWATRTGEALAVAGIDLNLSPIADVAALDSPARRPRFLRRCRAGGRTDGGRRARLRGG